MDEYVIVLCRRLKMARFVSGEASLKVDAIHRITAVIGSLASSDYTSLKHVCELLRIYTMDWDRTVRSSAFRCLRYCLKAYRDICEDCLVKLGIPELTTTRIESCKSSTERASILRFVGAWVNVGSNVRVIRSFVCSLIELLLAAGPSSANSASTELISAILSIVDVAVKGHPKICYSVIQNSLDSLATVVPSSESHKLLSLAKMLSLEVQVLKVPAILLTPEAFSDLLSSATGVAMLRKSIDIGQLSSDIFLETLISRVPLSPLVEELILPFREELAELLIASNRFRYLCLFKTIDTSEIAWKYPDWIKDRIEISTSGSTSRRGLSRRSSLAVPLTPTTAYLGGGPSQCNSVVDQFYRILEGPESNLAKSSMLVQILMGKTVENPVLNESLTAELYKLVVSMQHIEGSLLYKQNNLPCELYWLLSLRHAELKVGEAIETGWLNEQWNDRWIGLTSDSRSLGSFVAELSLTSTILNSSSSTIQPETGIWGVNGVEMMPVKIWRPSYPVMIKSGAFTDKLRRELVYLSRASQQHLCVFFDSPLQSIDGSYVLITGEHIKTIVMTKDPVFLEQLERNLYTANGKTVTEASIGDITVVFEIDSSGLGLIAVLRPVTSATTASVSNCPWERSNLVSCLSSTAEGTNWMRSCKMDDLKRAFGSAREQPEALWVVSSLLMNGEGPGSELGKELGVPKLLNGILSGEIDVTCSQLFTACRISELINDASLVDIPRLEVLCKRRLPCEIPDLPPLPAINESANSDEAFTESHIEILNEISSLASSVHFKQKSASLNTKKQTRPALFQSVPLWYASLRRMEIGKFSLQTRRVFHSLFLHTVCDDRSLELFDSLISL
jgi:hypothetical protein